MERYTTLKGGRIYSHGWHSIDDLLMRLAAYEDTGLTPKEVAELKKNQLDPLEMAKVAIALKEIATLKKALELAVHDTSATLDELSHIGKIKITKDATDEEQCQYFIRQAQEQEAV